MMLLVMLVSILSRCCLPFLCQKGAWIWGKLDSAFPCGHCGHCAVGSKPEQVCSEAVLVGLQHQLMSFPIWHVLTSGGVSEVWNFASCSLLGQEGVVSSAVVPSGRVRPSCGLVSGSQSSWFLAVSMAITNKKRLSSNRQWNLGMWTECLLDSVRAWWAVFTNHSAGCVSTWSSSLLRLPDKASW